jgi:GNAT-family acetyltransferase (TIGR03103 family)
MESSSPSLDPTSELILHEAERRGIDVEILAPRAEYFRLRLGGRSIVCRESLSQLTSAVALSLCDDKRATRSVLAAAGLKVPEQMQAGLPDANLAFLRRHGVIVVKPARGEQGKGISVGIRSEAELSTAIISAARFCPVVLLEQLVRGEDLRILVMGGKLVAAAVRRPPEVRGDGVLSIEALIEAQSERRARETRGESRIPLDLETERCVREAGYAMSDVPAPGARVIVRRTANVHTGGTIHDVTSQLHPALADAAIRAAEALDLPVAGLDLIAPSWREPTYAILEVNERPGLANHEPQPTAERFVDLLFPDSTTLGGARK